MALPTPHLITRSHFSFLVGSSSPGELVARAVELGLPALGLADDAGVAGHFAFWNAAMAARLSPLLGARVAGCALFTRDREGWGNLGELVTAERLGEPVELPRLQAGLHVVASTLERALALRGLVDRLWLELPRPARSAADERDRLLSGIPLVASTDAHFARPEDHRAHVVLAAIRENALVDGFDSGVGPGRHLRDLGPLFADVPAALANNERIAADCAWRWLPAPVVFPAYPVPGGASADSFLRVLAEAGLRRRYGAPSPAARERLDRELDVISRLGFPTYFLVVHDIVRSARERGAPLAGRGSGASSLVAYALGLTNVCPLRYGLQFERFLHEGRTDWPDLDLDFCWRTRDEVIDDALRRAGPGRAAMVSSHQSFQDRGALREAARVHGLSDDQLRALRRVLPADGLLPADVRPGSRGPVGPERLAAILADARRILGRPAHLAVHPGGVVLAPGPLARVVPLQRAAKGVLVTQLDKDGVEAAGLVKIDLLGNRAVSTIRAAADLVRALDGWTIDVETLPDPDPPVVELLREARTVGVNQLESPAMRRLLRMLQPRDGSDVMQALALVRPGAAGGGMKEAFLRRRRGLEPWSVDPRLAPVLEASHGVLLYEDDPMLVHAALTGRPLAEGDRFRRRLAKARSPEERAALGREFGALALAAGTPIGTARDAWRQVAKFDGYSFCMSHAASYARLAWAAAWMKAHHPVPFWIAALNNNQGMYEKRVYLAEAARDGVPSLPPCVNASGREFSAEGAALRAGLGAVAGLSEAAIDSILAGRPWDSLQDLRRRAALSRPEAHALVRCGALDFSGRPRAGLLLELAATWRLRARRDAGRLVLPDVPEHPPLVLRRWEVELLGWSPAAHLLDVLRPGPPPPGVVPAARLPELAGRPARVLGVLDALRVADAGAGRRVEFLTLEDPTGLVEASVPPAAYARVAARVRSVGPWLVDGVVEEHLGAVSLRVLDAVPAPP